MRLLCGILISAAIALGQTRAAAAVATAATEARVDAVHSVDPGNAYHRVYAVVPLVGSGTHDDPKRPMFTPLSNQKRTDRSGIIAYQWQMGDNGTEAIVEFVFANPAAVPAVMSATTPGVILFERGKAQKQDIEAALQQHKKGFTLNSWIPVRPQ